MLQKIRDSKLEELNAIKAKADFSEHYEELITKAESMAKALDFKAALIAKDKINIITEIKKASPSKGLIKEDFDYLAIAKIYEEGGAVAISVLTETQYFLGSMKYLEEIKSLVNIPVLRKDFLFDDYHVYEARAAGADTLLLIVAMLSDAELSRMLTLSRALKMEPLVEVHTEEEMERAIKVDAKIIGINNRDLSTFKTDLNNTVRILNVVSDEDKVGRVFISESGINHHKDIVKLRGCGASAFLIGESLMREDDIAGKLKELIGN